MTLCLKKVCKDQQKVEVLTTSLWVWVHAPELTRGGRELSLSSHSRTDRGRERAELSVSELSSGFTCAPPPGNGKNPFISLSKWIGMRTWINAYLLSKLESLRLGPQHPGKKWVWWHIDDLSSGKHRRADPDSLLPRSRAKMVSLVPYEPPLIKKIRQVPEGDL